MKINKGRTFNHRDGMSELEEFQKSLSVEERARKILSAMCEMGCCDNEKDGPCEDRQAKYLSAQLVAYGEERYRQGLKDGKRGLIK